MRTIVFFLFLLLCEPGLSAQSGLEFSRVLLVDHTNAVAVPEGKVWKIVNVMNRGDIYRYTAQTGTGSCGENPCNGSLTRWVTYLRGQCSNPLGQNLIRVNNQLYYFSEESPVWLPEGSVVQGSSWNCDSDAGWYYVNGSCLCPENQEGYNIVSVIEFTVVP